MKISDKKKILVLKDRMHEIIFEADTPEGKLFDVLLLGFIVASVCTVMLETVPAYHDKYLTLFIVLEWIFTVFFTVEYILRLFCTQNPIKYAKSFFGIIDLMAILPAYISLFIVGTHSLVVIRALRLLRVFRIFKLASFIKEGQVITRALIKSRSKIFVFLFFIILMVCIFGSVMYLVEGGSNPTFDSIPRSVYWAVVTLTTVGYGDISPITPFGQFLAGLIMIMGYAIIAVPTGIVTAETFNEMSSTKPKIRLNTQNCRHCFDGEHDDKAIHCKTCGKKLHQSESVNI